MILKRLYFIRSCSLHAFALGEAGRRPEALRAAEVARARDSGDAVAVHAGADVLYKTGRGEDGLTARPARIAPCIRLGWFRDLCRISR